MAVIHCKNCGGSIELSADKTFGTCEFCGSIMTFPKVDDDQRAAAFNRGNHFRRIGEFDKALAVYERIVAEDNTDAEAHWCCALCRFGIEYVEDPATLEWMPTCHRASFDSFLEDVDYKAALEHSDGVTRRQYQKEANKIAEVQRGILAQSQNAEPYDVFICYKETDENGQRTRDSLLAQEIYYELTEEGRKVFFARITLEAVAGQQYEPIIFAALNSAKVMIVVGTKPEHLNAVWVKNEWSRFLALMKKDRTRLLLPCYRDMDPYDLPDQLSVLQSYDMAKIGFIQDLTRGIDKVLSAGKPAMKADSAVAPLLRRVALFLEEGDWQSADEYCEKVLDREPENSEAYLGKLMAQLQVRCEQDLAGLQEPFDTHKLYRRAYHYASPERKKVLEGYNTSIIRHKEDAKQAVKLRRCEDMYASAKHKMDTAATEEEFLAAAKNFRAIPEYEGFKDAAMLASSCEGKAEALRQEAYIKKQETQYAAAMEKRDSAVTEADFKAAAEQFRKIPGYRTFRDALQQEKFCMEQAELARKEYIYLLGVAALEKASTEKGYNAAAEHFCQIPGYKDAGVRADECAAKAEECRKEAVYAAAVQAAAGEDSHASEEAARLFASIPGYKDADIQARNHQNLYNERLAREAETRRLQAEKEARERREAERKARKKKIITTVSVCAVLAVITFMILLNSLIIPGSRYTSAVEQMELGNYAEAQEAFILLGQFRDSAAKAEECRVAILEEAYNGALALYNAGSYEQAIEAFTQLGDYRDSALQITLCHLGIQERSYQQGLKLMEQGEYQQAYDVFVALETYQDSPAQAEACLYAMKEQTYQQALALMEQQQYQQAYDLFMSIPEHNDATEQATEAIYQVGLACWEEKDYEKSNQIFESLGDYKDSQKKIHTHKYSSKVKQAAACVTEGIREYSCKNCDHSYTEAIPATGHDYKETVKQKPTCTKTGEKELKCQCGAEKTESIPATGHSYDDGKVTKAAGCTTSGVMTYTCFCGESFTETIKPTGHSYQSEVTTPVGCDTAGVTTFRCACGDTYTETTPATGHIFTDATCEEDSVCYSCGMFNSAALGHTWKKESDTVARCTRCSGKYDPKITVKSNVPYSMDHMGIGNVVITKATPRVEILRIDNNRPIVGLFIEISGYFDGNMDELIYNWVLCDVILYTSSGELVDDSPFIHCKIQSDGTFSDYVQYLDIPDHTTYRVELKDS